MNPNHNEPPRWPVRLTNLISRIINWVRNLYNPKTTVYYCYYKDQGMQIHYGKLFVRLVSLHSADAIIEKRGRRWIVTKNRYGDPTIVLSQSQVSSLSSMTLAQQYIFFKGLKK